MTIEVTFSKTIRNPEIAEAVVGSSEQDQCEILCAMVDHVQKFANSSFAWPLQCRRISDELRDDPRRPQIIQMLRDLVDHLEDYP